MKKPKNIDKILGIDYGNIVCERTEKLVKEFWVRLKDVN